MAKMCGNPECTRYVHEDRSHVTYGAYSFCDLHCFNIFFKQLERLARAADSFAEKEPKRRWWQR